VRYFNTLAIIVFLFNAHFSYGQTDTLSTPYLNGHRFVLNEFVNDPFMYTSFNLMMGSGISSTYNFPTIPIGDKEINIKNGDLLFGSLHAGFSQKINDWAMAYLNVGFTGRFGAEPASMLTQGLNSITGISYGMKFNLLRTQKSTLSAGFRVKNYQVSVVNVLKYIKDVIEENPTASINQNSNILAGNLGLSYAYAHNDLWGIYATGRYFFGDGVQPGDSVDEFNVALALDFDLSARTKIPIGLNMGFSSATVPEFTLANVSKSTIYSFQIAYVGRDDLQIGLTTSFFEIPLEIEGFPRTRGIETAVSNISMVMRYFF